MKQSQKYLAEVLGTFTLVFGGCAVAISSDGSVLVIAFGFGVALLAGLYAFGEVSGGHFNPAVSLGMFLDRRLSLSDLVGYWLAQFTGAVLAAVVLLLPYTQDDVTAVTTTPGSRGAGTAFAIELILTALFVAVILQTSKSTGFGSTALVAIPLTLFVIHLAAVPLSGSSVNPARTFGTALIGNRWTDGWIYFVAPPLGAVLGWAIHAVVVKGDTNLRDDLEHALEQVRGSE